MCYLITFLWKRICLITFCWLALFENCSGCAALNTKPINWWNSGDCPSFISGSSESSDISIWIASSSHHYKYSCFIHPNIFRSAAATSSGRSHTLLHRWWRYCQRAVIRPLARLIWIECHGTAGVVATSTVDVNQQRRFSISYLWTPFWDNGGVRRRRTSQQFQLACAALGDVISASSSHDALQLATVSGIPARLFIRWGSSSPLSGAYLSFF